MRRAAELGEPASRSRRLLAAAGLAVEIGRRDLLVPLLGEVSQLKLGELDRARVTWVEEIALTRPLDAERFNSLIAAAEQAEAASDHDLRVNLLWLVASRAWWVDPGPEARRALIDASHRLGDVNAEDPRVFAVHAYADPMGHAAGVLTRLKRAAGDTRLDTGAGRFLGPAALVVGAFDLGAGFLKVAVDGLRTDGRLRHLPRLLRLYACMAARVGDWDVALTAADEARRLAEEFADPQAAAAADTTTSLVAAMRGDEQTAELMAARAEMVAEPVGANITMAFAQFGKVLAALVSGRHRDAYASAERLFDPADSAYHPVISSWLIADLAEAARHVDQLEAARARVSQVEASFADRPGTWIELGLRHARALVADPTEAGDRFDEALSSDLTRVAVPARQDSARIRPVAPTPPAGCRLPRGVARRARHLRRARMRDVGRAGAPRVARIRGTQPAARARGSRSTDGAGAADRPASGGRAVQPRNRPAPLPLASHDQPVSVG